MNLNELFWWLGVVGLVLFAIFMRINIVGKIGVLLAGFATMYYLYTAIEKKNVR